jgi:excisionase family DNA binding protein
MERETISIGQACELVSVSRRTIYNWLANGKLEYVRTAGGSVRIFIDTLWRDPARRPRFKKHQSSSPASSPDSTAGSEQRDQAGPRREERDAPRHNREPDATLVVDESDILTFD